MGTAKLILYEEVRARRFCCKSGLGLREGCLESCSHHGRHWFHMIAIPERLNPLGKPSGLSRLSLRITALCFSARRSAESCETLREGISYRSVLY